MGDLVPLGTYIAAPATAAEIDESVRYMLASNQNTLVLQYPSLSVTSARRVMEAALAAVKTYCEQCYNTVNCTYSAARVPSPSDLLRRQRGRSDPDLPRRGHGGGHCRP